ncbi:GspS/AspS pilotin family protein [Vibrio parahaemolyticus]|uniref:type II secretion system pilot lipoprotein GspS-beta n=1 Tax=Vibrio parahaemolyticus TaxID=670 RepID=UPI001EEC98AB|nr:type II secretion system pilot lipoprotein GspS-beta [Vibrio parahaemolyticus]MCG6461780.1 GspS/AspS pilotin family protein [Vibrio parahaemolyticus]
MLKSFFIVFGVVALLQGCAQHDDEPYHKTIPGKLALNRADLLMPQSQGNSDAVVKVLSTDVVDRTILMDLQMPSLTMAQEKTLPTHITQYYCKNKDIRKLLTSGIDYHISVFNLDRVLMASFDINDAQCL